MKAFAKRTGLLLGLIIFAAVWVLLMSLGGTGSGRATAADGTTAEVVWVDKQDFPQVAANISIVDGAGQPVGGLTQEAFVLQEDDVTVNITSFFGAGEQPVIAMLVIDRSGSMSGDKMAGALDAAHSFVDRIRPGKDQAGIIAFDSSIEQIRPLTDDQAALHQAINTIRASGGTLFYDALYEALEELQTRNGRRIILALTDGQDTGSRHTPDQAIALAQAEGIAVYTIGLGEERMIFSELDGETLERIALETGGEYHQTPSAAQLADLYARILETVQNEYVLGYTSPTPELDGTTRRLAVTVTRPPEDLLARGDYSVSGILSTSLNWQLFLPLFLGLLVILLVLLFLPGLLAGRPQPEAAALPPSYPPAYPPAATGYAPPPAATDYTPPQPVYTPPPPVHTPTAVMPPAQPVAQLAQPAYPAAPSAPDVPCPHCNRPIRAGAKFCRHCGQTIAVATMAAPPQPAGPPLVAPTHCPSCGTALRPGSRFCGKCGTKAY
jgi:Ca-activated chloride channel family protein